MTKAALSFAVSLSVFMVLAGERLEVKSPDGRIAMAFETGANGMAWSLSRDGKSLVGLSRLGLEFIHNGLKERSPDLAEMKVVQRRRASADTTWEPLLYRRGTVRDRYNELAVDLVESEARVPKVGLGRTEVVKVPRKLTMVFRAYDEGVAFRYVVPEQEAFDGFEIRDELTEWRLPSGAEAWVTTYANEATGQESTFDKMPVASIPSDVFVGMPVVVETEGTSVAFCEAALVNWAGLCYKAKKGADGAPMLVASLAKLPPTAASTAGSAVIATTPATSPWRVAIVGDDGLDLLKKNDIIVNLNPPPDPSIDFGFVKGGASSWDWWVESNNSLSTELTHACVALRVVCVFTCKLDLVVNVRIEHYKEVLTTVFPAFCRFSADHVAFAVILFGFLGVGNFGILISLFCGVLIRGFGIRILWISSILGVNRQRNKND